ncbi:hypothetical protein EC968_000810, partial [Mortierella alpina]
AQRDRELKKVQDEHDEAIAFVLDRYNTKEAEIVSNMQAQVNRRIKSFVADGKRYAREALRLGKHLTELHDLNRTQFDDHLARLKQQTQSILDDAIRERDESTRLIEGEARQQRLKIQ